MLEIKTLETMEQFCSAVVETLDLTYLRDSKDEDIKRLLNVVEKQGTIVLLGAIYCCQFELKNCRTAWKDDFKGKKKKSTVKFSAISDRSLWTW